MTASDHTRASTEKTAEQHRRTARIALFAAAAVAILIVLGMKTGSVRIVGGVALLGGTIVALKNQEAGLWIVCFLLATDGFIKGLHESFLTLVLKDWFVAICLLRWAGPIVFGHYPASLRSRTGPWVIAFLAYATAQLFNQNTPDTLVALAGLRVWILWLPLYFIGYDVLRERVKVRSWMVFTTWVLLAVAVFAIYQGAVGLEAMSSLGDEFARSARRFGYDTAGGHEERVYGTTVAPGFLGAFMSHGVLLAIGLAYMSQKTSWKAIYWGIAALCMMAMLRSGSRLSFVSLAIAVTVFLVMSQRYRTIVPLVLVTAIGIGYVAKGTEGRLYERFESLTLDRMFGRAYRPLMQGYGLAVEHPLGIGTASGVGVGRAAGLMAGRWQTHGQFVENEYGQALANFGFPGAFLFGMMFLVPVLYGWRAVRTATDDTDRVLRASLLCNAILTHLGAMTGAALYGTGPLFWLPIAALVRQGAEDEAALDAAQTEDGSGAEEGDGEPEESEAEEARNIHRRATRTVVRRRGEVQPRVIPRSPRALRGTQNDER